MRMPVMDPFARALAPDEIAEIAAYLSKMPEPAVAPSSATKEERAQGASLYAQHCASCHGTNGEGQDGLFASRLCGQYAGYLRRRLAEVAARARGDADAIMQDAIDAVPVDDLPVIVTWLAGGKGCKAP
jgi:cytochrome c553